MYIFLFNFYSITLNYSVIAQFLLIFSSIFAHSLLIFSSIFAQLLLSACLLCLYSFSASVFHFVLRSISSQFLQQFNFLLNFNTRDFFHAKETVEKGPTELMVDPIRGNKPSSSRYLEDIFQHRNLMMMCAFR